MLKRLCSLLVAGAAVAACSDTATPTAPLQQPTSAEQSVVGELTCRVNVSANAMSCGPSSPAAVAGRSSNLILGGQNVYVKLSNPTPVASVVPGDSNLVAQVSMQNLTGQPWNTGNGVTADTGGVKVFFVQHPTNGVTIASPDTGTFTAANQVFFKYLPELGGDQILSAGETSSPKTWRFDLHGAASFTFTVMLVTKMPDENGTLRWVRDTTSPANPGTFLLGVWGTSKTDVWAGGLAGPAALQHWNGSTWTPFAFAGTVNGLWGAASNDFWAATDAGIAHWNGASWALDPYPAADQMIAVWGMSATDVYAGGGSGILAHWNGTTWTDVPATGISTSGASKETVTAIWGASATDVYVGTTSSTPGQGLHHWDGANWTTVNAGINAVRSIWGSSGGNIFVGGDNGLLRRFNGGVWTTVGGFGSTTNDRITGIWGTVSSNIFVVQGNGTISHFNGASIVPLPNANTRLSAIWGSGRDVFVAGYTITTNDGIVLRGMR